MIVVGCQLLCRLVPLLIRLRLAKPSADENFFLKRVCRLYPVLCSVTASGLSGAQRHLVFCFALRPFGVPVPPKTSLQNTAKKRLANFFRAPPRKQTFGTCEPGP